MRYLLIILILASLTLALYEEETTTGRAFGMGNVLVAAGESPGDIPLNPALAAKFNRYSISGTYSSRWSLSDFNEYSASAVIPAKFGTFFINWHERSVIDIYGERKMGVSFARKVIKNLEGGITTKFYLTSAPGAETWNDPAYRGPQTTFCLELGLLYQPFDRWQFGFSTRNFGEPEIKLLESSEKGDNPAKQLAFGASWEIAEDFILAADLVSQEGDLNKWFFRSGMEITFFDVLALRAGANGERLSMGTGLKTNNWSFDAALANHRWLGNIYRFTLSIYY